MYKISESKKSQKKTTPMHLIDLQKVKAKVTLNDKSMAYS